MKHIKENGYEHYVIDTDGNVYNTLSTQRNVLTTPKLLRAWPNKNTGYMNVVLRNGIKAKCVYVHRLVACVYISNPLNLPQVNHKNFVRSDNTVSNLEWVTAKQNSEHKVLHGEKLIDKLLKQTVLIKKGVTHYELNKDMNYLSKLWNVCKPICSDILNSQNIEITRFKLPNVLLSQITIEVKNNVKWKGNYLRRKEFIEYIKTKYNVHFTIDILNRLKKTL